jgi:hypothetical protein
MLTDPIWWVLVALGIAANFVLALKEAKEAAGVFVGPLAYIRGQPYAVILGLLGGIGAGFWMAADVEAAKWGLAAGLAGTGFFERIAKKKAP